MKQTENWETIPDEYKQLPNYKITSAFISAINITGNVGHEIGGFLGERVTFLLIYKLYYEIISLFHNRN